MIMSGELFVMTLLKTLTLESPADLWDSGTPTAIHSTIATDLEQIQYGWTMSIAGDTKRRFSIVLTTDGATTTANTLRMCQ